jgi:hypothetical protein
LRKTDLFEAGSILLPQRVAELLAFPGRHDGQVDALVQALDWTRSRRGEFSVGFVRGMY